MLRPVSVCAGKIQRPRDDTAPAEQPVAFRKVCPGVKFRESHAELAEYAIVVPELIYCLSRS